MSTALRSLGLLCVLSAESSRRAPCIHARLRRLATEPCEKCGLTRKTQADTENTERKKDELESGVSTCPALRRETLRVQPFALLRLGVFALSLSFSVFSVFVRVKAFVFDFFSGPIRH